MEDRRIRRTRNALNQALAELVAEKEYDEITIQEIADRADIGHRTFYRHYTDKDELLVDVMKDALAGFQDLLVLPTSLLLPAAESDHTPQENGRRLFEYVGKREELFRVLFQRRPSVYDVMLDLARKKTIDLLNKMMNKDNSPIPFQIIAHHMTTSTISLMKLWLEEGKPYSADVMGEYLVQMVFKPMRDVLSKD